jgi:hypothetical protein
VKSLPNVDSLASDAEPSTEDGELFWENYGAALLKNRGNGGGESKDNVTHSTPQTTPTFDQTFNAPTIVTDLKITIATGGATKTYGYDVTFYRTRAH